MQRDGLSLSEVARRVGRDKGGISRRVKSGDVRQGADGTFNEDHVREDLMRLFNPGRDKPLKPRVEDNSAVDVVDEPITTKDQARAAISLVQSVLAEEGRKVDGAITFDDARTANEILKARKTLREIEQAEGLWLPRDEVVKHVASAFTNYRNEIRQMPARFGAQIAAEAECDVTKLDAALTRVINDYLNRLAAPVVRTGD